MQLPLQNFRKNVHKSLIHMEAASPKMRNRHFGVELGWTLLGRIETPTLVVHADHTFPFVLEGAARLRRVNRQVQTQEVSGTHCFMQEQPANTAAQVKSFLLSA